MPAPSNTTFLTATLLTLPAEVTQDVRFEGFNYTVYYYFVAAATGYVSIHAHGPAPNSGYIPTLIVYDGPLSSPTVFEPGGGFGVNGFPVQFPVVEGQVYALELEDNPGDPALLTITGEMFINDAASVGAILVNDDTEGFWTAILDPDTAEVLQFIDLNTSGESGFQLESGEICLESIDETPDAIKFYRFESGELVLVATVPHDLVTSSSLGGAITGAGDHFYIANAQATAQNGVPAGEIGRYSASGDLLATFGPVPDHTVAGSRPHALAVDPAETILYYRDALAANAPIKRWDLLTDTAMADLVAGIAGQIGPRQILCLTDGTVLAVYVDNSPLVCVVKHYDTDGTVLHTYDFSATTGLFANKVLDNQIAHSLNRLTSFWIWLKLEEGVSRFMEISVEDGSVLRSSDGQQFEVGIYNTTVGTIDPLALFGHSESCVFLILNLALAGDVGVIGPYAWIELQRRVP